MKKKTMNHTDLLVLALLAEADMYGYQIITELEKRSEHIFEMKEGTLYPVLHGLWKEGAVECYEAQTPTGRARKNEAEEWRTYARGMEAVLSYAPAVG